MPKWRTVKRRIGVTGLRGSGKTVFLTSLINHLKNHDPYRFPLAGSGAPQVRAFRELPVPAPQNQFNYEGHRDAIVNRGRWPEKTRDSSVYRLAFERSDWRFTRAEIELFDFPGERIADAAMVESKSHAAWSRYVLHHLENLSEYREHAAEFLDLVRRNSGEEKALTDSYRLALARLILNFKPLVTPSTFLLGQKGDAPAVAPASEIAGSRHAGLGLHSQFSPLSREQAAAHPGLAREFALRYRDYRKQVVVPLFSYLSRCHRLAVLIDVPVLLSAGSGMYDDNLKILEDLFSALDPGQSFLARVITGALAPGPLKWRPGRIGRVAFVASKADMVHPDDRDRQLALLKQMTRGLAEHRDVKLKYAVASAVVSTQEVPGKERTMAGLTVFDQLGNRLPPGSAMRAFQVSALPPEWPPSWKEGDFNFVRVQPNMPPRRSCPPDQFGLAQVFDFLAAESWWD